MEIKLTEFFSAYVQWLGLRSSFSDSRDKKFEKWLIRTHPEITCGFKNEPAMFRQMCKEIRQGLTPLKKRAIGMATLKKYSEQLIKYFLTLPETERKSFADFLEDTLQKYPTEFALKNFLKIS